MRIYSSLHTAKPGYLIAQKMNEVIMLLCNVGHWKRISSWSRLQAWRFAGLGIASVRRCLCRNCGQSAQGAHHWEADQQNWGDLGCSVIDFCTLPGVLTCTTQLIPQRCVSSSRLHLIETVSKTELLHLILSSWTDFHNVSHWEYLLPLPLFSF